MSSRFQRQPPFLRERGTLSVCCGTVQLGACHTPDAAEVGLEGTGIEALELGNLALSVCAILHLWVENPSLSEYSHESAFDRVALLVIVRFLTGFGEAVVSVHLSFSIGNTRQ